VSVEWILAAEHVRPPVSALLVLPCDVRRASDKHHVQASAKGKPWDFRYPAKHRGSPAIDNAARSGAIALQPAQSSVTPPCPAGDAALSYVPQNGGAPVAWASPPGRTV
jgi:hypothetical protein